LAFNEEVVELGSLDLDRALCDIPRIHSFLDFLAYSGQNTATVLKTLDVLRSVLERRMSLIDVNNNQKYQQMSQALSQLQVTRQAIFKAADSDASSITTIGAIVAQNRWPSDEEVRGIIPQNLSRYKELRAAVVNHGYEASDYELKWVLSVITNALTIYVAFARPGVWQGLSYGDGLHISKGAHGAVCATSRFKTWKKYLIQALFFSKGPQQFVRDYMTIWRPISLKGRRPLVDEPLFVTPSKGVPVTNWSEYINVLWLDTFGKKMTTTVLRYWKATKVALNAETTEERAMITEADCHGLGVTHKYYVKIWRIMDAKKARDLTERVCNIGPAVEPGDAGDITHPSTGRRQARAGPIIQTPTRRPRRHWDIHDEFALLEAYETYGTGRWKEMLEDIRPKLHNKQRTPCDLKDKIRHLMNKRKRKDRTNKQKPQESKKRKLDFDLD